MRTPKTIPRNSAMADALHAALGEAVPEIHCDDDPLIEGHEPHEPQLTGSGALEQLYCLLQAANCVTRQHSSQIIALAVIAGRAGQRAVVRPQEATAVDSAICLLSEHFASGATMTTEHVLALACLAHNTKTRHLAEKMIVQALLLPDWTHQLFTANTVRQHKETYCVRSFQYPKQLSAPEVKYAASRRRRTIGNVQSRIGLGA
jgi:hypothetical protein